MTQAPQTELERWQQQKLRQAERFASNRTSSRNTGRKRYAPSQWMAIDGEGWGTDEHDRQCYRLMVASTDNGFSDTLVAKRDRLTTLEIFDWLISLATKYRQWCRDNKVSYNKPRICGFALGYDYAHWLIDIADENIELLQEIYRSQDFESPLVAYPSVVEPGGRFYGLKLTAGKMTIHEKRKARTENPEGGRITRVIRQLNLTTGLTEEITVTGFAKPERTHKMRSVTVWDVFKYFQASFMDAARKAMTDEEREIIQAGKDRRKDAEHILEDEIRYSIAECRVLARLMQSVEEEARGLDLKPASWYGPGSLAVLALNKFNVKACYQADEELPDGLPRAARMAFVGGRFETSGHGRLKSLMQYDINSAYPYAISRLPCLKHSEWTLHKGYVESTWGLYHVRWTAGGDLCGGWGPWPVRNNGKVTELGDLKILPTWPWSGEAWVWGPEYRAGVGLLSKTPTAKHRVIESWVPVCHCSCDPFGWVLEWFTERKRLKAIGDPREKWLKLILNSLYGKLAQMVGKSGWHSWLWSGMITAHARSQLLTAITENPEGVVMVATDAVYSTQPLHLETGEDLGDWEVDMLFDVLIIQSGFHSSMTWDSTTLGATAHPKTRGLPKRYIDWEVFNAEWQKVLAGEIRWEDAKVCISHNPATGDPLQIHIGIGLAQQWSMPQKLGRWQDYPHIISFSTDKRPALWKAPKRLTEDKPEWLYTKPVTHRGEGMSSYHPGRGIGEDKFVVIDQPNAEEWNND